METPTDNQAASPVPQYETKPAKPGLYLGLFHGRNNPNEQMEDWGFNGPAIGPLRWCHTTYAINIRIEFEDAEDCARYFGAQHVDLMLPMDGDMIVFAGKYYGDWTVYCVAKPDCARPADSFRGTDRTNNLVAHGKPCSNQAK